MCENVSYIFSSFKLNLELKFFEREIKTIKLSFQICARYLSFTISDNNINTKRKIDQQKNYIDRS